jgi:hypothetical protein
LLAFCGAGDPIQGLVHARQALVSTPAPKVSCQLEAQSCFDLAGLGINDGRVLVEELVGPFVINSSFKRSPPCMNLLGSKPEAGHFPSGRKVLGPRRQLYVLFRLIYLLYFITLFFLFFF